MKLLSRGPARSLELPRVLVGPTSGPSSVLHSSCGLCTFVAGIHCLQTKLDFSFLPKLTDRPTSFPLHSLDLEVYCVGVALLPSSFIILEFFLSRLGVVHCPASAFGPRFPLDKQLGRPQ